MRKFKFKSILVFYFTLSVLGLNSFASESPSLVFTTGMSSERPTVWTGEFGSSLLFQPIKNRAVSFGPRLAVLWEGKKIFNKQEILAGMEGIVWLVNAFGLGCDVDLLIPTQSQSSMNLRVNPFLSTRMLRFFDEGAWALRIGFPYDPEHRWGVFLGLSLQLNGVYSPGKTISRKTHPS